MASKKRSSKRFSPLILLKAIAALPAFIQGITILALIGGGGYMIWQFKQQCGDTALSTCARSWAMGELEEMNPFKKSYARGAGEPLGCLAGEEYDAGLCYDTCPDGYTGHGPVCWKGARAKGRGVGRPIRGCDADMEKDGALCYKLCKEGYNGVGPVCWKV